jgi:hypothetical protein
MRWSALFLILAACRGEEEVPPRMPQGTFYVAPKGREVDAQWQARDLASGAVGGGGVTLPPTELPR